MSSSHSQRRRGASEGVRAVAPLFVGIVPFGLVFGILAAGSDVGPWLGGATSVILFAGAAQLATLQLIDAGAAGAVVIATALVINSRFLMYSAALSPHFREFPTASRFALPYLLTDQAFAISIVRYADSSDPVFKRWYYVGAALTVWIVWQIATIAGIVLGTQVPESWSLDFTIPLVFLALLIPVIEDRPGLVAAVFGGGIAVVASGAPYGLGLIAGALGGVAAGVIAQRMMR